MLMTIKKYLETIQSFEGKRIAVTGSTSGIGKQLTIDLLNKSASLVLLVRNVEKAKEFKDKYPNNEIDIIEYDQSSYKKIEQACDELVSKFSDLYAIVLNAGNLGVKTPTEDGYPGTIGVNYFGVRHFIDYISPKLKNKIRFVIQGSIVGGIKPKKNADLCDIRLKSFTQYNLSKIYLEAYFYKLVTENTYPNIDYVLTEPGISSTGIIRNFNAFIRVAGKYFLKIVFHSPKKACLPLLLGLTEDVPGGTYIVPRGLFTMSGFPKIKEFPAKRRREYLFVKEKSPN